MNVAHNVRRIGYFDIMDGIVPHWPRKAGQVIFIPRPSKCKGLYIDIYLCISKSI